MPLSQLPRAVAAYALAAICLGTGWMAIRLVRGMR
jgi:hypothetical protein